MIEPFIELPNKVMTKSLWVKSVKDRMRIFNSQIFDGIYYYHSKFNRDMHIAYMIKTFESLLRKAINDENVTKIEVSEFSSQYTKNLLRLLNKKLEDKVEVKIG